jgi:hypothetical protein
MKITNITANHSDIKVDMDDLMIINNALNEVCHGIDVKGFETRIGARLERVVALMKEVGALFDKMNEMSQQ